MFLRPLFHLHTSFSAIFAQVFLPPRHRFFCHLGTGFSAISAQVFLPSRHRFFCHLGTGFSAISVQVFLPSRHRFFCHLGTGFSAISAQVFLPPRHRFFCHLGTGFSWFPCVYKRMLRWFPRLQVATTCFSCSPSDLNFLVIYFIFMYMHNNHCHRVTAQLQLIKYCYYY